MTRLRVNLGMYVISMWSVEIVSVLAKTKRSSIASMGFPINRLGVLTEKRIKETHSDRTPQLLKEQFEGQMSWSNDIKYCHCTMKMLQFFSRTQATHKCARFFQI